MAWIASADLNLLSLLRFSFLQKGKCTKSLYGEISFPQDNQPFICRSLARTSLPSPKSFPLILRTADINYDDAEQEPQQGLREERVPPSG